MHSRLPVSKTRIAALLLGSAMAFQPAAAEVATATDAATAAASDIIVTGQRTVASEIASQAVEFGNYVQVVGSEEIEASGASNFAELAQFLIKGANVGYSPDEGEYTIRLDGGGDRDTLVVLDGVPLYDRGSGLETIWGSTIIDPHIIDRVEVFRGGNSLFFGSNGGIGVVSVVTKEPNGERKFEFGASYGSFNSRELWGNATLPIDKDGRHSIMVYGTTNNTDSPRIFAPESFVDNVAAGGGIQKYPLNRNNLGVKYRWEMDDKSVFKAHAAYTRIEFHDPFPDNNTYSLNFVSYPIVNFSFDRKWSDQIYTELTGYWSNPMLHNHETYPDICKIETGCVDPGNANKIIPFGKYTGRSLAYPNQGFGDESKEAGFRELGLNFRNTFTFKDVVEVVAGVQMVNYKSDADPVFPIGDDATTVTGVYFDVRPVLPFSPNTNISLAVRTDFADAFDSKTIWKFGLRQPIGDSFYVRANGGTSYSLPQINELYRQTAETIGNPNLKPEETETYNVAAGFAQSFGNVAVSAEVGYFHTDITNRIRTTSGLTPNTYFNNEAVTEIRGITADIDFNINQQWTANIGFTKQTAKPRDSDLQINETPEYMIQGQLSYRTPDKRLQVTLLPRYQGPEWATGGVNASLRHNFGNYFVMNGSIAYWLGDERQHKIQLRLVNIFDEKYSERYGFGNMRYSEDFITGKIARNSPEYFYGYGFEGKPRAVYISYQTKF